MPAIHRGRVIEFDDDRGLGAVEDAGGSRLPFHCTAITDGSRTIAVGTAVSFLLRSGQLGREEATAVTPEDSQEGGN